MKRKIIIVIALAMVFAGIFAPNVGASSYGGSHSGGTPGTGHSGGGNSGSGNHSGSTGTANSDTDICKNKYIDKTSAAYKMYCTDVQDPEGKAQDVVKSILETVFFWASVAAVIVIIIGGIFYMTSEGNETKVVRAKNAILYAVIGLIISLSAFAIVHFVLAKMGE